MTHLIKISFLMIFASVALSSSLFSQSNANDLSYFNNDEINFILGEKNQPWNYGRLSLGTFYMMGNGEMKSILGYKSGLLVTFDHGIHHFFKPYYRKKSVLLPGLRLELSYDLFGPTPVQAITPSGGLEWLIPIDKRQKFKITLGGTSGVTFQWATLPGFVFHNTALAAHGFFGLDISISTIFISTQGRFSYIMDNRKPWMGYGGMLLFGYQFPTKNATPEESK